MPGLCLPGPETSPGSQESHLLLGSADAEGCCFDCEAPAPHPPWTARPPPAQAGQGCRLRTPQKCPRTQNPRLGGFGRIREQSPESRVPGGATPRSENSSDSKSGHPPRLPLPRTGGAPQAKCDHSSQLPGRLLRPLREPELFTMAAKPEDEGDKVGGFRNGARLKSMAYMVILFGDG